MKLVLTLTLLAVTMTSIVEASSSTSGVDRVVIEKARRTLTVYAGAQPVMRLKVALGQQPVGAKLCRGDNRTPEGSYRVAGRKENSDFHRALRISYPSDFDQLRAREAGCDPGGDIMIHGLREDWGRQSARHREVDWTKGCIAVTNEEIERLWALLPDGVEVVIRP
ncbi:MAG TPA: L,D-transpeptidase family protein [Verrucomicrobiae bacterium]|nr:L,D-transpeptidase family protein [Verrucomicrobiae bacterium]